jgi:hypothetical protein
MISYKPQAAYYMRMHEHAWFLIFSTSKDSDDNNVQARADGIPTTILLFWAATNLPSGLVVQLAFLSKPTTKPAKDNNGLMIKVLYSFQSVQKFLLPKLGFS